MNGDIATLTTGLPQNLTTVFSSLKRYFVHWDYQKPTWISIQMTFRNGRPKVSFNILGIRKNSNVAVTFINRTKPEKNSNFPHYFCHRKGSTTTIYGNFSLVTWHQKNTLPYQLSIIALGLSSYPCFPFLAFCMAGVFLASAAAYYGIIDQKCWLLFVCHCREARGCEQKEYS